jgi:hypothetical protein
MLFLFVMEILSGLIRHADSWSLFQKLQVQAIRHCTSFYVDDLILFVRPLPSDLQLLRNIFDIFQGASGLGCNLSRCQLAAIRCTDFQLELAVTLFPCQVIQFSMKYLGITLAVSKLPDQLCDP